MKAFLRILLNLMKESNHYVIKNSHLQNIINSINNHFLMIWIQCNNNTCKWWICGCINKWCGNSKCISNLNLCNNNNNNNNHNFKIINKINSNQNNNNKVIASRLIWIQICKIFLRHRMQSRYNNNNDNNIKINDQFWDYSLIFFLYIYGLIFNIKKNSSLNFFPFSINYLIILIKKKN